MKKVLIVDPLSYSGHVNYNYGVVRTISKNHDYSVITNENTSEELKKRGIDKKKIIKTYPNEWNIEYLSKRMKKWTYHIAFRYFFIKNIINSYREAKHYDVIVYTSIDIYSFVFLSWLFDEKCYIIDHGIGNVYSNSLYRFLWRLTNKRINLIVLEEFIRTMTSNVLKGRKTFVVHHPLPKLELEISKYCQDCNRDVLLFAPSSSNDEAFLQNLIDTNLPQNFKIVAKSKRINHNTQQLKIYNGFLSSSDYQTYLNRSNYILLAYSPSYNYRISAVMFESLVMGKPVLILNNNTLWHYGEIFQGHVGLFSSVEDMVKIVNNAEMNKTPINLSNYSDDSIAEAFSDIFENA